MKKTLIVFGLLCMGMGSVCGQIPEDEKSPETVKQIIEEKNAQLERWYAEGALDSVVGAVGMEVVQLPPHHEPIRGREAFRKNWEQSFGFGTWRFNFEVEEVKLSGNQAVELGKYTLDFTPQANSPIPEFQDRGHYLVLWEKQEGDWKIVWDAPVSSKSPQEMMVEMQKMGQGEIRNTGEK